MGKKYEWSYESNVYDPFVTVKHSSLLRILGATEEQIKDSSKQQNWLTYAFNYGQTSCLTRQMVNNNVHAIKRTNIHTGEISIFSLDITECVNIPPSNKNQSSKISNVKTNKKPSETGLVYILTNQSFKENYIKVGITKNLKQRLKSLDNTSTPEPFECFGYVKTNKYQELEKFMHNTLEKLSNNRIRKNREFFEMTPEDAFDVLKGVATLIDDAEIVKC